MAQAITSWWHGEQSKPPNDELKYISDETDLHVISHSTNL